VKAQRFAAVRTAPFGQSEAKYRDYV